MAADIDDGHRRGWYDDLDYLSLVVCRWKRRREGVNSDRHGIPMDYGQATTACRSAGDDTKLTDINGFRQPAT